jgi:hypothetical protein
VSWTDTKALKAQLTRLWERGEFLKDRLTGNSSFPLRLTLKAPSSKDLTERFNDVRVWAKALAETQWLRIEWQEVRHRVQGVQRLPSSVWVDTWDDAVTVLGKRRDWAKFDEQVSVTQSMHPVLLPWLEKHPMQALALADVWPLLLSIVTWMIHHPRPNVYLRQIDLPGIHSKFIEAHRAVLSEWFDLALPAGAVDHSKTGLSQFAARYGFVEKPNRIRFRTLDPTIQTMQGLVCPDITLDADSFSRLDLAVQRVFITENEINFLAFPEMLESIVIFGAGYGWDAMAKAQWLKHCDMYYWGDIDTHGFAILDQLRGHFPQVRSLLMDAETLYAHMAFWGQEDKPTSANLLRLSPKETALYDDLRYNRIRPALRLEQEYIGFECLNLFDRCSYGH